MFNYMYRSRDFLGGSHNFHMGHETKYYCIIKIAYVKVEDKEYGAFQYQTGQQLCKLLQEELPSGGLYATRNPRFSCSPWFASQIIWIHSYVFGMECNLHLRLKRKRVAALPPLFLFLMHSRVVLACDI